MDSGGDFLSFRLTLPYTKEKIPPRGDFPEKIKYSPLVETILQFQNQRLNFKFPSVIDSGADFCVFPAQLGELIGIDIEKGKKLLTYGVGGKDILNFHHVKVIVIMENQPWEFSCFAGFSRKMNHKGVGLLGRQGFFNLFSKIEFLENQRKLVLTIEGDNPSDLKHGGLLF